MEKKKNNERWFLALVAFALVYFTGQMLLATDFTPTGEDISGKLESVGTIVKTADTIIFGWVTKLIAGIFIISAAISLKNMRIHMAGLCFVAALVILFVPKLVKNISQSQTETVLFK